MLVMRTRTMARPFPWMENICATPVMSLWESVDRLSHGTFLYSCRFMAIEYVDLIYLSVRPSIRMGGDGVKWVDGGYRYMSQL